MVLIAGGGRQSGWGMARRSYAKAGKDYPEPIAVKAPPLYTLAL